jgi:hypothetical protein
VTSKHPGLQFLVDEIGNDTSKIDIVQNPNYDFNSMVEDMIGQYQKLQDLDEFFPDLLSKSNKKRKGEVFRKDHNRGYHEYEVQFPIQTKLVEVDTS